ncbi:YbbR-like domain-containing protein [Candidatus Soleaferrea massiliensis]|uniref:CdaR family protein n=1 Tax=Candidatus Soleaferrea massiliensis TaxID=1470354 RepID=UPI0012E00C83|nr:CdaR family protein [Candidatus Soleaferrea massiliensis]
MHKVIENKRYAVVLSIFLSVILWFIIAMTFSQTTEQTIPGVVVDLSGQSDIMQEMGLNIISDEQVKVNVRVSGERTVVGGLKASDIKVTPDIKGITSPGVNKVQLKAEKSERASNLMFEIVSISPKTVELNFNKLESVKVPIEIELDNVSAQEGYTVQAAYTAPTEITVSGPKDEISIVKTARVKPTVTGVLTEDVYESCEVTLLDESGNEIENKNLTPDYKTVTVTIPVLKTKEIPMTVAFNNLPKGFKKDSIKYRLMHDGQPVETIQVAAKKHVVDKLEELQLGYISPPEIGLDKTLTFEVVLPSGVLNVSKYEKIEVEFDMTGMTSQVFTVSTINMINKPSNYDISLVSPRISGVTLIGPTADLDSITAADVVAEIDFSQINLKTGQSEVKANISIPAKGTIWAYGDYVAQITVEEKSS